MVFTQINQKFKNSLFDLIESHQKIFITCHYSPDDDAISSSLSLHYALSKQYPSKDIQIIITGQPINRYSIFENFDKIIFTTDISTLIKEKSLVFFLDGAQYSRFSNTPQHLTDIHFDSICIDHHSTPPETFTLCLQENSSSSTAELIYLSFDKYSSDPIFNKLILLGILGDTGTFNYVKPNQTRVFDIVKNILQVSSIDIQDFKASYSLIESRIFEIIKELIKNTKYHQINHWPNFSTTQIPRAYISKHNLTDSDVSQASDIYTGQYLRMIKGYPWGIVFKPYSDGSCRVSFRSLPGSVNVRLLAQNLNIGGGHDRAAGGTFLPSKGNFVSPSSSLTQIKKYLKSNIPTLS